MTKEDLIEHCRYYKGEEKIPSSLLDVADGLGGAFWIAESAAVDWVSNEKDVKKTLSNYIKSGFIDEDDDAYSFRLKAYLFAYCEKVYSDFPTMQEVVNIFKKSWLPNYLAQPLIKANR